ncbi:MAG TPA: hypothetical protein DIC34_05335 [Treponema sp.]|nr:MAG: hypothetical protein A2Y36_12890 [Treponema sp. GWA1_62_8]OHE67764.1 MAG: hypothetical protein A2001_14555 [Treponema sp. GWC1_61_84]HCM25961.1 hypothetical protein [Treponema sp.]
MKSQWFIIADDFTGAGDSAIQFGSAGRPVRLLLSTQGKSPGVRGTAAVVVDTDTRFLSPDQAYERVEKTTRELYEAGARSFFKKIDSTLRGNPADEIAAVMDAASYRFALVAPAAPRNGRTVIGGHCLVNGRPISDTEVSKDPFTPVKDSRIASILERRFPGAVRELGLELVRSDGGRLAGKVAEELARGARVFVLDAETMDDLKAAAALIGMDGVLFVGSSGLAEAVASVQAARKATVPRVPLGRSLFVIGSVTAVSALQCARLAGTGNATELVVDSDAALSSPVDELQRLLSLVRSAPAKRALLIRTSGSNNPGSAALADKYSGLAISGFLGELTLRIARDRGIRFLFASGGDTAARIAGAMKTDAIDFFAELLPGLPFGSFRSAALGRKLYFVTKSGGFGGPDAMADALALVSPEPLPRKELSA